ncbi:PilZ domain-containing protein [Fangia hongkongensis]|uniref:PilZ domain-containing protein n=1 Tax=Fangia hongkongensis TaxID=270495 RepID=UPI00036205AF|nr:PilZ domain-containing protein [Fangia hongkongensis]MBK2123704.1 PilZ domain-containing protein [Fangia hongkongensis]
MPEITKINIHISSKQDALAKYLPYVQQGAILVEQNESLNLGDELDFSVAFPELKQELDCRGKVVWISAKNINGKHSYGIQCMGDEGIAIHDLMENYLAGLLND